MGSVLQSTEKRLDMEQQANRRNDRRFQVRTGAIAALNDTKLGTITEISRVGLAFRYIDFGYEEEEDLKELQEVSIVNDAGFALHNVPCKVIQDDYSLPEYPFSSLRMNKCLLQFVQLTAEQQAQLDYFIATFAIRSLDESVDFVGEQSQP
jgi:hypothetical protein